MQTWFSSPPDKRQRLFLEDLKHILKKWLDSALLKRGNRKKPLHYQVNLSFFQAFMYSIFFRFNSFLYIPLQKVKVSIRGGEYQRCVSFVFTLLTGAQWHDCAAS